jgi:hypothetical protein
LKSNRGASSASLWPIPTPPSGGSGEQFRAEHLDYFLCPVSPVVDTYTAEFVEKLPDRTGTDTDDLAVRLRRRIEAVVGVGPITR